MPYHSPAVADYVRGQPQPVELRSAVKCGVNLRQNDARIPNQGIGICAAGCLLRLGGGLQAYEPSPTEELEQQLQAAYATKNWQLVGELAAKLESRRESGG
ncbi:MAG: hypothetical protein MUF25_20290 [Pirellulaceae bacterium]|nr:hypothetical protein [Pirellulaceae bacterium]